MFVYLCTMARSSEVGVKSRPLMVGNSLEAIFGSNAVVFKAEVLALKHENKIVRQSSRLWFMEEPSQFSMS